MRDLVKSPMNELTEWNNSYCVNRVRTVKSHGSYFLYFWRYL